MAKEQRQDNLIQLIRDYQAEHPGENYELSAVIEWGVETGRFDEPTPDELREEWIAQRSQELQQAACKEHHRDDQGRRVRSFFSAKVVVEEDGKSVQKSLWNERALASWEFKVASVNSRFTQILGDSIALQTDVDSLNENDRPKGKAPIQLHWDFGPTVRNASKTG